MFERFLFTMGFCLYNFCRAFDAVSSERKIKVLSLSRVEIYAKYESLSIIFIRWKVALVCTFSFRVRNESSVQMKRFISTFFVVFFTTHFLKKGLKVLHLF